MHMTDLWTLKIANDKGNTLGFLFDSESDCKKAFEPIEAYLFGSPEEEARGLATEQIMTVRIKDNYGNTGIIRTASIEWAWITNVGQEYEGQKDVQILQAHAQANLQRRIQADPLLKQSIQAVPPMDGRIIKPS